MNKLSTFLSLIFLILLFVSSSRFVIFLSFVKSQKAEFRQQVITNRSSETKELSFSEDDLYKDTKQVEWKEHNKELVIDGLYHEVLSVKKTRHGYLVTLIEDKQENNLFRSYFQFNKQAKNSLMDISLLLFGAQYLENDQTCILKPYHSHFIYLPGELFMSPHDFKGSLLRPPCVSLTV